MSDQQQKRFRKPITLSDEVQVDAAEAGVKTHYAAPKEVPADTPVQLHPLQRVAQQFDETDDQDLFAKPHPKSRSRTKRLKRWCFGALSAFVGLAAGMETYELISTTWQTNLPLSIMLIALLTIAAGAGGRLLLRGWRYRKKLRQQEVFRARAEKMKRQESFGDAPELLKEITQFLQTNDVTLRGLETYQAQRNTAHNDRECLTIYSDQVLAGLDKKAYEVMARHARESALMVALSPLAVADMLLMLWRSLLMMEQVAAVYGCKYSVWGRMVLLKKVLRNMMLAGAAELISDAGVEVVGGSIGAMVSGRIAQGVGAGLLTARLGIHTMQVCRPLAFEPDNKPRLKHVRKRLLTQLTERLEVNKQTDSE